MRSRSLVTLIAVPLLALLSVYRVQWPLSVVVVSAGTWGLLELYALARSRGGRPQPIIGALTGGAVLCCGFLPSGAQWLWPALALGTMTALSAGVIRRGAEGGLRDFAITVGGVLYVSLLFAFVLALRRDFGGRILMAVWLGNCGGDIGAFLVGRRWGRRKLMPRLSPNKTVEGALAGLIVCVAAFAASHACFGTGLPGWAVVPMALLIACAGVLGDLCESLLKRDAQVKDSGARIPGHGGMLDAVDSLLFAVPAAYFATLVLAYFGMVNA